VPPELVDTDGDGIPDVWEIAHHTDPNNPDSSADPDHDGMTNLEEFLAGTDPWHGNSRVQLEAVEAKLIGLERAVVLRFHAVSNKTYTLLARDSAQEGGWTSWASLAAEPVDRQVTVTNIFSDDNRSRFYRLVTP